MRSEVNRSGEEWPSHLGVKLRRELSQPNTLTFTVSSTWIYIMSSSLPLPLLLRPPFLFLFLEECSSVLFSHSHYITLWFQLSEGRNQIVLTSVKNQKGTIFLGHGNALEESWDFASGPQWDSRSVVTSEVMSIFNFVSVFEAVSLHWTSQRLPVSQIHITETSCSFLQMKLFNFVCLTMVHITVPSYYKKWKITFSSLQLFHNKLLWRSRLYTQSYNHTNNM